ncbi:hypothetical protein [Streptomyces sp. NPDC091278]|uniref:hypothetical protein n=1 Tax=Streptomyces sp. NPDC091278 TaxID=3155301 RepID=UPI00344DF7B5
MSIRSRSQPGPAVSIAYMNRSSGFTLIALYSVVAEPTGANVISPGPEIPSYD